MDKNMMPWMDRARTIVELEIEGTPVPAGSYRPIPIRKAGVLVGSRVTNANPRTKLWQHIVRGVALDAMLTEFGPGYDPVLGPVLLQSYYWFARPKCHFYSGKRAGELRPDAPSEKTTAPDTSKLVRAVEDSLTGIVYRDDAQIVSHLAYKGFGDPKCRLIVSQVMER